MEQVWINKFGDFIVVVPKMVQGTFGLGVLITGYYIWSDDKRRYIELSPEMWLHEYQMWLHEYLGEL